MEFKSGFPWQFYLLTAIAQAAGVSFYAHKLTALMILFILSDMYVLMKFIFKTKYVLDGRGFTAKRFLFGDLKIDYSSIVEIKPTTVFTTGGFSAMYRVRDSFNFFNIVYTVNSGASISGRKRKVFIAHPKDKEAFFEELISHVGNAEVQFEFPSALNSRRQPKKK